jgi:Mg/Co/Ni transporter MgtE
LYYCIGQLGITRTIAEMIHLLENGSKRLQQQESDMAVKGYLYYLEEKVGKIITSEYIAFTRRRSLI